MINRGLWCLAACTAAVGLLLVSGCGGSNSSTTLPDPTVMFYNASPDSVKLDFLLNDSAAASGLDYLAGSSGFQSIPYISDSDSGYDLAVRDTASQYVYDDEALVFDRNTDSIAVAIGEKTLTDGDETKRLREVHFTVDRTTPNGSKARLIVLHAFNRASGFQTPSIDFQNPGDNPLFKTSAIAYGATATLTVDSGTLTWEAKRDDADADVVYVTKSTTLDAGGIYLVIVGGVEGASVTAQQPSLTFVKLQSK